MKPLSYFGVAVALASVALTTTYGCKRPYRISNERRERAYSAASRTTSGVTRAVLFEGKEKGIRNTAIARRREAFCPASVLSLRAVLAGADPLAGAIGLRMVLDNAATTLTAILPDSAEPSEKLTTRLDQLGGKIRTLAFNDDVLQNVNRQASEGTDKTVKELVPRRRLKGTTAASSRAVLVATQRTTAFWRRTPISAGEEDKVVRVRSDAIGHFHKDDVQAASVPLQNGLMLYAFQPDNWEALATIESWFEESRWKFIRERFQVSENTISLPAGTIVGRHLLPTGLQAKMLNGDSKIGAVVSETHLTIDPSGVRARGAAAVTINATTTGPEKLAPTAAKPPVFLVIAHEKSGAMLFTASANLPESLL